jgi:hypothetical protein
MYKSWNNCFFRLHYQSVALADAVNRENFFPTERKVIQYVTYSYCERTLFHETPIKLHQETLHLIISPHVGIKNVLMRLISFQNVGITNVQLQIATAHFKQCVIPTVSVLIHTQQSNINAKDKEGKGLMIVRGTGKRPFSRKSVFAPKCDTTKLLYCEQQQFMF